jgi:hypothetical protein
MDSLGKPCVGTCEKAHRQLRESKLERKMSQNHYLGVNEASGYPIEKTAKFTSRWAIPRVEPEQTPKQSRKRRQINNMVLLFIIYVFKEIKKSMFTRRLKVKYRTFTARNGTTR